MFSQGMTAVAFLCCVEAQRPLKIESSLILHGTYKVSGPVREQKSRPGILKTQR